MHPPYSQLVSTDKLMLSILFLSENKTFKWPTNLQHLNLQYNRLSNRFVSSLKGLPHLQFLDLSHNQLQGSLDISGQYFLLVFYLCSLEICIVRYFKIEFFGKASLRHSILSEWPSIS